LMKHIFVSFAQL